MKQFNSVKEIWNALDCGKIVYWSNEFYKLTIEETHEEYRLRMGWGLPFSYRNGKHLRVTCISN